jgi:mono/diheme cytochrome c family protein
MSRLVFGAALLLASLCASAADPPRGDDADLVGKGRYLTMIGGCNDCHTAGFAPAAGKIPESQWLLGDTLGWSGPWGTTYPSNLRLRFASMDLTTFKAYARTFSARPPMPYWAVNAMSERDLEALYAFVKSLGAAGEHAPAALPPGVTAKGPVVRFPEPPTVATSGPGIARP